MLVLDDSLSSVDAETEREILGHLDADHGAGAPPSDLAPRRRRFARADQIAVLDEGALVELGTHDELLARGGVYAELYRTRARGRADAASADDAADDAAAKGAP